jgi:tRNA pseudouridine38-40 synthase
MKKEAKTLCGKHDFRSFQGSRRKAKDTVRTIKDINITEKGKYLYIDIEADGFLYNMVRIIVGTLIEIARGKYPKGSIKRILKAKNRKEAGPTAKSKGLFLVKVKY